MPFINHAVHLVARAPYRYMRTRVCNPTPIRALTTPARGSSPPSPSPPLSTPQPSSTAPSDVNQAAAQSGRPRRHNALSSTPYAFPPSESVQFWIRYRPDATHIPQLLARVAAHIAERPSRAPYWLFNLGRNAFFSLCNISTVVLSRFAKGNGKGAVTEASKNALKFSSEAITVFLEDYQHISDGVYNTPWNAYHDQRYWNPIWAIKQIRMLAREGMKIRSRLDRGEKDVSVWLGGSMYPAYYAQTYHYQTDGWLSTPSADVYETSTEMLFGGRQDAMQRLALIPISRYMRENKSLLNHTPQIVEIGAGTGRLATFVRDNWPHADLVLSDLSPFYLQKARENMTYWSRQTKHTDIGSIRYIQSSAEQLPLATRSADILYSVYLFHELPPEARRAVIAEAARVLRPGGLFVLVDSVQIGDRPYMDSFLRKFPKLNEPWYDSFLEEDFAQLVCSDGVFEVGQKEMRSVTKMMSFLRTSAV